MAWPGWLCRGWCGANGSPANGARRAAAAVAGLWPQERRLVVMRGNAAGLGVGCRDADPGDGGGNGTEGEGRAADKATNVHDHLLLCLILPARAHEPRVLPASARGAPGSPGQAGGLAPRWGVGLKRR